MQERLAAFIGGVAIVHVGGHTEVEMREKKDRVDDALHATKAALEEGLLPGGGIALLNASKFLASTIGDVDGVDQQKGYDITVQAIEKPFYQILENAGYALESIRDTEEEVINSDDTWVGYNPRSKEIVNMLDSGIVDPTKVTRLALENAASVAGTMLITETVISNIKEKESASIDPNMMM